MKYEETKEMSEKDFRRLTGVKRKTFTKMIEILKSAEEARRRKGGHKSKLSIEDMLLLALEYLREYRTYFHIAHDFGIHETTAIRICRWAEEVLMKDGAFSLPGKKALLKGDVEIELKDVTESPIERPKKNENETYTTPARRSGTQKKG